jgi:HK97 gp10 family phage protein
MADDGLADILRALKELPREIVAKGGPLTQGLAAAGKIVRDRARQLVPVSDGEGQHLRDQIILARDREPTRAGVGHRYMVTVRFKGRKYKNNKSNRRAGRVGKKYAHYGDFYYWRFLEFGTSTIPARAFMRRAFEGSKSEMLSTFIARARAGVQRVYRKVKR